MIQFNFQQALTDRQAQKTEQREAEWPAFVLKLERSKTAPDPDSLLASLDRLGKTPDQLQATLDKLRERRRLAGLMADVPRHREEYAKHHAELNEEIERFAPLLKSHENLVWELRSRRSGSQAGERDGGQAEGTLRETCSPTLLAAIRQAGDRLAKLDESIQRNGWDAESVDAEIVRKSDVSNCSYAEVDAMRAAVAALTERLSTLKTEGERLAALRPDMVDELAKLREQSLAAESF